jgi:hypothetical protein
VDGQGAGVPPGEQPGGQLGGSGTGPAGPTGPPAPVIPASARPLPGVTFPLQARTAPAPGGEPPAPTPGGRRRWLPALIVVTALAVAAAVLVIVRRDESPNVEALGSEVGNALGALAEAERAVHEAADAEGAAVADDLKCWFSYPSADAVEPNDFLRCGPILLVDSGPDEIWITVPITFTAGEEGTIATVVPEFEPSTTPLDQGEELVRPDGGTPPSADDVDLEPPPPPPAESGFLQVSEGAPPIDLEEQPEDGRLNGKAYRLEVDGFSYTDRVALDPSADPAGNGDVLGAASGEQWLVAQVTVDSLEAWSQPPAEFALVVDGQREDLGDMSAGYYADTSTWTIVASVPTDAEEVALVGSEVELEQLWSFTDQRRAGDAPEVLYRDRLRLSTDVNEQFSLPYAVDDADDYSDIPFGGEQASLTIGSVGLHYVVEDGDGQVHTASGPDRALVYLTDVQAEMSGGLGGYEVVPENMVLSLPDGTEIGATRLSEDGSYLLGGFVAWDVPADIETATITITPGRGPSTLYPTLTFDFQDGTASFPVDFRPA